jgi:putative transposase
MVTEMYRTVKMPIKPRSEQRRAIDRFIELNRYIYNASVTAIGLYYEASHKLPSEFDMNKLVTKIRNTNGIFRTPYVETQYDAAHRALKGYQSLLDKSRKEYFRITGEKSFDYYPDKLERPRYKKQGRYHSISYIEHGIDVRDVKGPDGRIKKVLKLGKIKGNIKCLNQKSLSQCDECEPVTCTITRKDYGTHYEYYASVTFDVGAIDSGVININPFNLDPNWTEYMGVDLGVSHIAALSDGTVFDNPHDYAKRKKDFQKKHESYSRTIPYTEDNKKRRNRLKRSYDRLSNMRKDRVENISKHIVNSAEVVVMERLSIRQLKGISRSKAMMNAYSDASLGTLIRRIGEKAAGAACRIVFVNPRGTSRRCSACGADVPKRLSDRIHNCPYCGLTMDRDVNAAINIAIRGSAGDPFPDIKMDESLTCRRWAPEL